jgi:hypothetical protein
MCALGLLSFNAPDQDLDALRRSQLADADWTLRRWVELPGQRSGIIEARGREERLRVLVPDGRRWRERAVATAEGEIRKLEPAALVDGEELVLFRRRRAPDETVDHLQVLRFDEAGRGRVIWEEPFILPDRQASVDLPLGPTSPEVFLERPEGERARIVWRRGPRLLRVEGRAGPISVSVGAERSVYFWEPAEAQFRERPDYRDFLPAHDPVWVEGLEDEAGEGPPAAVVADGDPRTGWALPEGGPRSVTLHFEETISVRMLRVVPGCVTASGEWREAQSLSASVSVGGGFDLILERTGGLSPGVAARGFFPLGKADGTQWFVFFSKPRRGGWVRLEFLDRSRGCIAEISVH